MKKLEEYIESQLSDNLQRWISVGAIIGAILFPLFGIPESFRPAGEVRSFTIDRIVVVGVLLAVYFLNKLKRNRTYQSTLLSVAVVATSIINEIMTLNYGGHVSPFYVGLLVIAIVSIGLCPISVPFAFVNALLVYFIYLVPILVLDRITQVANFLTANFYLLSTIGTSLTWRIMNNKLIISELRLQHELTIEKNKLDQLVQERTRDLRTTDQWYRSIFENSHDGIIILKQDGEILNTNDKACSMHGFAKEQLIGANFSLLVVDNYKPKLNEWMQRVLDGDAVVFEADYYDKKGKRIALETSSKLIPIGESQYILMVNRDISEKKMIQEQLFEAQKMESISTLAGGIAHDFRNMITAILGYVELINFEKNASNKLIERTNIIKNSAQNAGKMVSQLLSFARRNKYEMSAQNLNEVVADTVKLIEMTLPDNIQVLTKLHEELTIEANVASIENVIINLISNAKDAMPHGGSITVSTGRELVSEKVDFKFKKIPVGEYAVFTIKDTGSGISKEIMHRIFEPFYTTKERGKGTGLGLAMVYGVVTDHNGYITVDTEPGSGSTFTFYFPIMTEGKVAKAKEALSSVVTRTAKDGSILLVDDDRAVLTILRDTLELRGYHVIATESPLSAIDIFKEQGQNIKLVITDISMPLMDGYEFIRQIKITNPDIKIITISAMAHNAEEAGVKVSATLSKPFDPSQFESAINQIIDS